MRQTLIFLARLLAINLKSALSLRGAFVLRTTFTLAHNLIYLLIWWVLFDHYGEIRGWRIQEVILGYGLVALCSGFVTTFAYGTRMLSRTIDTGDLDTFLVQPQPVLLNVAASRIEPAGFGDMLTGMVLLFWSGYMVWPSIVPILFFVCCGIVLFLSITILISSIAFWLTDAYALARDFYMNVVLVATQPNVVYGGVVKALTFTLMPVAFIALLPVEFVRTWEPVHFAVVVAGTVAVALISLWIFHRGLKRYGSGNRFGVRV